MHTHLGHNKLRDAARTLDTQLGYAAYVAANGQVRNPTPKVVAETTAAMQQATWFQGTAFDAAEDVLSYALDTVNQVLTGLPPTEPTACSSSKQALQDALDSVRSCRQSPAAVWEQAGGEVYQVVRSWQGWAEHMAKEFPRYYQRWQGPPVLYA